MNYLDPYNFYFELPLYTSIEITADNLDNFKELVSFTGRINGYNPTLKEQTTYSVSVQRPYGSPEKTPTYFDKMTRSTLTCLRTDEVFEYYFKTFKKNNSGNYFLIKYGQFPSIADLHIAQIKDYNRVLSKEKLKELTRAIGLAANGVGIGSFIYLRRTFEYLIDEAHVKGKLTDGWDEEKFQKSRMGEKIQILASELPDFLVEHRELYSILSKGVHELEEDECLQYFMPIRTAIEMILDEKIILYEKEQKRNKASNAIKGISGKLRE